MTSVWLCRFMVILLWANSTIMCSIKSACGYPACGLCEGDLKNASHSGPTSPMDDLACFAGMVQHTAQIVTTANTAVEPIKMTENALIQVVSSNSSSHLPEHRPDRSTIKQSYTHLINALLCNLKHNGIANSPKQNSKRLALLKAGYHQVYSQVFAFPFFSQFVSRQRARWSVCPSLCSSLSSVYPSS